MDEKETYIPASEICEELGISSALLSFWKHKLGLLDMYHKGSRETLYTWESYDKILSYAETLNRKEEEARAKRLGLLFPDNLEELRAAHPLVKDDRCFILTWFPEM